MDSSKNSRWIIPFKKFSRLRVNNKKKVILFLYVIEQLYSFLKNTLNILCYVYTLTTLAEIDMVLFYFLVLFLYVSYMFSAN